MPQTRHVERHFTAGETVRDIVIGMSDGLTVPFALAAGLTGAINSAGIIVTAGLAEIAAGSIAMGLGGYLAAKSDAEHYAKEREREKREVVEIPEEEMREVAQVFHSYGLTQKESAPIVEALSKHSAGALHRRSLPQANKRRDRAFLFSWVNAAGAVRVWLYQRTLYRHAPCAQRSANRADRQSGSRRRVLDRASDFMRSTKHPQITLISQINQHNLRQSALICGLFLRDEDETSRRHQRLQL